MSTVLVLQRGHVGRTSGNTGTDGEQQLVTLVAEHVVDAAHQYGVAVRVIDADEPLDAYGDADAFLALHGDGSRDPDVRGAHYGHRTPEGKALGRRWLDAHVALGFPGGTRPPNGTGALSGYYGTRYAVSVGVRTACIVELGFLTNPADRTWLFDHPERCAHAVLAAVARTEPKLDTPAPAPTPKPKPTPAAEHPEHIMAQLAQIDRDDNTKADTRRVQALLAAAGHVPADTFDADGEPDGIWGDGTDAAVEAFQDAAGITVDGIVGPVTWHKLLGVRLP